MYASLPVQPGQTLFVGSSLIEEGPWDELFANDAVLNRGISAETTHDLLARVDALSDARPASIFLYTGGNNLSRRNETVEQTLDGIAGVLDALTEARPDTRLYLSTLLPREARYAENVVSVNSGMRRLAEERGITVIDAHAAFADANGALHSDLTNDGIHLNGDGYRIWAAAIADAMDGLQFER